MMPLKPGSVSDSQPLAGWRDQRHHLTIVSKKLAAAFDGLRAFSPVLSGFD